MTTELSKEDLERKKLCLEIDKLEREVVKLQEEIIFLEVKRKALIFSVAFTGVGVWFQLLRLISKA